MGGGQQYKTWRKRRFAIQMKQPSMHQHDRKPPIDGSVIPPQSLCKSLTRQARLIYSSQGSSLSFYYWSVVVCLHSSPQTRLTAARLARMSNLGSYALINDQSVALHYAIRDYGWHRTDFERKCHQSRKRQTQASFSATELALHFKAENYNSVIIYTPAGRS